MQGQSQNYAEVMRKQKGWEIARAGKLRHKGDLWFVPSQSSGRKYRVLLNPKAPRCNCPDFELSGQPCKHIYAVEYTIKREFHDDGLETVTETVKVTYRQDWKTYNKAQTTEKAEFMALLHGLCQQIEEPEQVMGRPRLTLSDMVFASTFKVYSTFSGRRFMTDLKAAHDKEYLQECPHYNSISRYLRKPELTPILKELIVQSSLPLKAVEVDFAPDSSGFPTRKFINWNQTKYQGHGFDEHDWIKVHLMTGVKTNVVTAVEIGGRHASDFQMFPHLLKKTAEHFKLRDVCADKGYLSHDNLKLVEQYGGTPYIPFKSNTVLRADGDIWSKMYHLYAFNREEFLAHYHKRSNVESTFSMLKAKFGDYVRSKDETAQVNEVLCKVLAHNVCVLIQSVHELGIELSWKSAS
jgi:transposase